MATKIAKTAKMIAANAPPHVAISVVAITKPVAIAPTIAAPVRTNAAIKSAAAPNHVKNVQPTADNALPPAAISNVTKMKVV
jgi:hypothetical protein